MSAISRPAAPGVDPAEPAADIAADEPAVPPDGAAEAAARPAVPDWLSDVPPPLALASSPGK